MATSYEERLLFPLQGSPETEFFTQSGLLIAKGYKRVVIGQRGPYIEFADESIVKSAIIMPDDQKWRLESQYHVYYHEYRSTCASSVKLYFQQKTVAYADYLVGLWYVSPFSLKTADIPVLIQPIDRKKKTQ